MKKENWLYLVGGVLLGALVAYGLYDFMGRGTSSSADESGAPAAQAPSVSVPVGVASPGVVPPEEFANLERILAMDPKNVEALTRLGNLLYDTSRWAEALGYYRRALENGPQNSNVLTDAGICCQQLRRFEEALEYFRRANEADPAHWQSLYNTAVVAGLDLRRFDAADAAISKLLKVNPAAPGLDGLRQNLARARASQGKPS